MADARYAALIALWPSLTGTTVHKISVVNAMTVAGPTQDVDGGAVLGYLALSGKLASLEAYAAQPPAGSTTGFPQSVMAAQQLVTLLSYPSFTGFQTSQTVVYTTVQSFINLLASDTASGIVQADVTALLALAATTLPWWQSVGLTSPINAGDLAAAGLS